MAIVHRWDSRVGGTSTVVLQPGQYKITGGTIQPVSAAGVISGKPLTGDFAVRAVGRYQVVLERGRCEIAMAEAVTGEPEI